MLLDAIVATLEPGLAVSPPSSTDDIGRYANTQINPDEVEHSTAKTPLAASSESGDGVGLGMGLGLGLGPGRAPDVDAG